MYRNTCINLYMYTICKDTDPTKMSTLKNKALFGAVVSNPWFPCYNTKQALTAIGWELSFSQKLESHKLESTDLWDLRPKGVHYESAVQCNYVQFLLPNKLRLS